MNQQKEAATETEIINEEKKKRNLTLKMAMK